MPSAQRERLGIDLARQQTKLIRELKSVRVAADLSVAQVAAEMAVDEAVVYRFEKGGTNPTLATVRRYALAVGAMLDLGAKPLAQHTSEQVRAAASLIEHDPDQHAKFFTFHAGETSPTWLTGGHTVTTEPTEWTVRIHVRTGNAPPVQQEAPLLVHLTRGGASSAFV